MQQTGIVRKTHCSVQNVPAKQSGAEIIYDFSRNGIDAAEVEITRSTACGESCASCGLCPGRTAKVVAINEIGAKSGDTVIIDMSDKKVLGAAFLVYIVPLIMLIIGYCLSYPIFRSEGISILTGFILMAVTFIVLMRADRKLRRKYIPRIVKIIDMEAESGCG